MIILSRKSSAFMKTLKNSDKKIMVYQNLIKCTSLRTKNAKQNRKLNLNSLQEYLNFFPEL